MATVYLAHDLKHDRKVALKVLKPELAAVIGAERFLREIKTIASLQHPHILGLIDSGEVDGTAYFVMPFVEGESLRDLLNREKQLSTSRHHDPGRRTAVNENRCFATPRQSVRSTGTFPTPSPTFHDEHRLK